LAANAIDLPHLQNWRVALIGVIVVALRAVVASGVWSMAVDALLNFDGCEFL